MVLPLCSTFLVLAGVSAGSPHAALTASPPPGAVASAARPAAAAERLSKSQTQLRVVQFRRGEHWALRSLVLLSLGDDYHPAAAEILLTSLKGKDDRLRAYAIETLARTEPGALRAILGTELVENLIRKQLRERDDHYRGRVQQVLAAAFPAAEAVTKSDWERLWYEVDKTYTPEPWIAPPVKTDGKSAAGAAFERALDLYESGLEVVICIDSTGSMQPTIDAAAAATEDLVSMLKGIAPSFRLGLVHYKDFGDLGDGASVLESLSKRHDSVGDRLDSLAASGGGDTPERIESGLGLALDPREMKWKRDTNKLVVVIADAPAHPDGLVAAVQLAEDAFKNPFGKKATKVRATRRDGRSRTAPVRPFVTACIGVGRSRVQGEARQHLTQIAEAGGGTYAELLTDSDEGSSDAIVGHVLKLSFGAQYEDSLDDFVDVFFTYQRSGFFK